MELKLRQETTTDYASVFKIIEEAFKTEEYSDSTEKFLVERLRNSKAFISQLSLVAEADNEIVGHIILTKIQIKNGNESFESLALAPVSVKPSHQKMGIGGQLIKKAHAIAKELGYKSIVLLGHAEYYPKFGYQLCSNYGIKIPFEAPDENCLAIELVNDGLKGVTGIVEYAKEFYE